MISTTIVNITNIKVERLNYSFSYEIIINDTLKDKGNYTHEHGWYDNFEIFEKTLHEGLAASTILKEKI